MARCLGAKNFVCGRANVGATFGGAIGRARPPQIFSMYDTRVGAIGGRETEARWGGALGGRVGGVRWGGARVGFYGGCEKKLLSRGTVVLEITPFFGRLPEEFHFSVNLIFNLIWINFINFMWNSSTFLKS